MSALTRFARRAVKRSYLYRRHRARSEEAAAKARTNSIADALRAEGCSVLEYRDVVDRHRSSSQIAHVVGSGWSVLKSQKLIAPNDFVVGANMAAYLDIAFSAYFVENASGSGLRLSEYASRQFDLLKARGDIGKDKLYFKNIWQSSNSVERMVFYYGERASFVLDYNVKERGGRSEYSARLAAQSLIRMDKRFIKQARSSIVPCISLSRHAGCQTIVVHGVDFGGPYFYEVMSNEDLDIEALDIESMRSRAYSAAHETAIGPLATPIVLKALAVAFRKTGVSLLSATEFSPSSDVLPVYRRNT